MEMLLMAKSFRRNVVSINSPMGRAAHLSLLGNAVGVVWSEAASVRPRQVT